MTDQTYTVADDDQEKHARALELTRQIRGAEPVWDALNLAGTGRGPDRMVNDRNAEAWAVIIDAVEMVTNTAMFSVPAADGEALMYATEVSLRYAERAADFINDARTIIYDDGQLA